MVAQEASSLGSLVRTIAWLEPQGGGSGVLEESALNDVKDIVLDRIRGSEQQLSKRSGFGMILFRWRDWAEKAESKDYVARLTESDDGLLDFLVGLLSEIREHVAEFIDPETLVDRVSTIKLQQWAALSQRQQDAVAAFLDPRE